MPRRTSVDPLFDALLAAQDRVIHRDQALAAGLTRRAVDYRLRNHLWQVLLPRVYLSHLGEPGRRRALTEAGLVVFHSSPRRLTLHGRIVIAQLESAYLRLRGRGLPAGVEIVRMAA